MSTPRIVLIVIASIAVLIGLYFGLGYLGVIHTRTVGKAQQNAQREVFENTQSYVEGKRQEAIKFYKEYREAKTDADKNAIKMMVSQNFANFDQDKYLEEPVRTFVYNCKYGNP
jgi:hypothetical protein